VVGSGDVTFNARRNILGSIPANLAIFDISCKVPKRIYSFEEISGGKIDSA